MSKVRADIIFAVIILFIAVLALFFRNLLIAETPISLGKDILAMNPRVFPNLVLIFISIITSIFLYIELKKDKREKLNDLKKIPYFAFFRQASFIFLAIISALALTKLGFTLTMFFLMSLTSILLGNRNIIQILIISSATPVTFYILVTHILRTQLPEVDIIQRLLLPILQNLPSV
ncbi:MAG: hypothetical protein CBC38_06745 [Gammaproteobacteria bacterium TMED78]|nr:MAG: hypothetical protein CBC38_06745 [Gammaproteobacteria bacterium TMED78]|tara:strand:- start:19475 stop:20002 length:528 start_codon:yes stop_codon:yes gene_type:complete